MMDSIPTNAIAEVVIRGLATGAVTNMTPLVLHRGVPTRSKQLIRRRKPPFTRPEPKRPLSTLPPPGNARIAISLSEQISNGRCGCTFRVAVESQTFPEDAIASSRPPPLCVKIAGPGMSYRLSKEAWCYEELEKLQGVAIPRCYGWFEAKLGEGQRIEDICGVDSMYDVDSSRSSKESGLISDYDDSDDSEDDNAGDDSDQSKKLRSEKKAKRNAVKMRLRSEDVISILLLEELRERLLDVHKFRHSTSFRDDIYALYEDICEMGVAHLDCRPQNILRAACSPPGLPSVKCPRHECEHQWRIIDFHIACKSNVSFSMLMMNPTDDLANMFKT
ncbi:hypothetical protein DFH11DRAFT_729715 [Phellopilus nigrolimitatus]|nr:hypothetical protein DFH11DRAFT_729715 [Phellopilus nigrolimitatus]